MKKFSYIEILINNFNEVVIPNETGWLVPVFDSEAIANALVEVKNISIEKAEKWLHPNLAN